MCMAVSLLLDSNKEFDYFFAPYTSHIFFLSSRFGSCMTSGHRNRKLYDG